ncbi:uncharacterized protein LOC141613382 [Silene latifolia]|uniref:uncharacterized protein LOC141613382 n=1 Tax=Silene latifolia TaxID=37657 RepID=UPI003D7762FB
MAHFVERLKGDRKYLCINNGDHGEESETNLPVYKSLLRAQRELVNTITPADFQENMSIPARPSAYGTRGHTLISTLPTQPMQDEIFPLLGRRIISGDTRWGCRVIQIPGESTYVAGYWEWTEDVLARYGAVLKNCSIYDAVYASLYSYVREPCILRAFLEAWCSTTNTLHTMFGEFSISLWDLHRLSGLPILGSIYDEAVPSYDNLHALDAQGVRVIPRACHFLLVVYHRLKMQSGGKGVTSQQWIEFWCKRSHVYKMPLKRRRESKNPPKFTGNPSGKIDPKPLVWTAEEAKIFESLGIVHESRKQTTYRRPSYHLWLCNFVLPESEDRLIRPETFEVASLVARGEVFSLAPPVLASIYRGLNMISTSPKPGYSGSVFPAHYLYSWLAHYFRTHHEVEPFFFLTGTMLAIQVGYLTSRINPASMSLLTSFSISGISSVLKRRLNRAVEVGGFIILARPEHSKYTCPRVEPAISIDEDFFGRVISILT